MASDNPIDSKEVLEPAGLAQLTGVGIVPDVPEESPEGSDGPGDHLDSELDQTSSLSASAVANTTHSEQARSDATPSDFMDLESDSESGSDYSGDDANGDDEAAYDDEQGTAPLTRFGSGNTHASDQSADDSHANDYFQFPDNVQTSTRDLPHGRPQYWFDAARHHLETRYGTNQAVLKHVYSIGGDEIERHPRIARHKWTRGRHDNSRPKSLLNPATQSSNAAQHGQPALSLNIPLRPARPSCGLFDDEDDIEQTTDAGQTSLSPPPIGLGDLPPSSSKTWAEIDTEDEADEDGNWAANFLADYKAQSGDKDAFPSFPSDNGSEVWKQTPADDAILPTNSEVQSEADPDAVRTSPSPPPSGSPNIDQTSSADNTLTDSNAFTVDIDATANVSDGEGTTQNQEDQTSELNKEKPEAEAALIAQLGDCKAEISELRDQIAKLKQQDQERESELLLLKERHSQLTEQLRESNAEIDRLTEPEARLQSSRLYKTLKENDRLKKLLLDAQKACQHLESLLAAKGNNTQEPQPPAAAPAEPSTAAQPAEQSTAPPPVAPRRSINGWNFADPFKPEGPETDEERQARWKARSAHWKRESPRFQASLRFDRADTAEAREQRLAEERRDAAERLRVREEAEYQAERAERGRELEEEIERSKAKEAKQDAEWAALKREVDEWIARSEASSSERDE